MKQRFCCNRTESFNFFSLNYLLIFVERGRVDAFGPEGRGFESRSIRHARDLGHVLHLQLPEAIRRVNSDTVSIAVVGKAYRNIRNEGMNIIFPLSVVDGIARGGLFLCMNACMYARMYI